MFPNLATLSMTKIKRLVLSVKLRTLQSIKRLLAQVEFLIETTCTKRISIEEKLYRQLVAPSHAYWPQIKVPEL